MLGQAALGLGLLGRHKDLSISVSNMIVLSERDEHSYSNVIVQNKIRLKTKKLAKTFVRHSTENVFLKNWIMAIKYQGSLKPTLDAKALSPRADPVKIISAVIFTVM